MPLGHYGHRLYSALSRFFEEDEFVMALMKGRITSLGVACVRWTRRQIHQGPNEGGIGGRPHALSPAAAALSSRCGPPSPAVYIYIYITGVEGEGGGAYGQDGLFPVTLPRTVALRVADITP